ncbi:unnamed protein product, partial [Dovyalis caffra]
VVVGNKEFHEVEFVGVKNTLKFSKSVEKVVVLDNAINIKNFYNEVTNVAALFEGVEVKDEGINEAINEGIIKHDADAIKVLDESDDLIIDFIGVDNLYSRRSSSLKLSFDDIGYKIFEYINWVISYLND